jgi:CheY-like chemotaxis protein
VQFRDHGQQLANQAILENEGIYHSQGFLPLYPKVSRNLFSHSILTVLSGSEGLELASVHSVYVVIVDYCMPQMNGVEVALELKRLTTHAPIIMLSSAVDIRGSSRLG